MTTETRRGAPSPTRRSATRRLRLDGQAPLRPQPAGDAPELPCDGEQRAEAAVAERMHDVERDVREVSETRQGFTDQPRVRDGRPALAEASPEQVQGLEPRRREVDDGDPDLLEAPLPLGLVTRARQRVVEPPDTTERPTAHRHVAAVDMGDDALLRAPVQLALPGPRLHRADPRRRALEAEADRPSQAAGVGAPAHAVHDRGQPTARNV